MPIIRLVRSSGAFGPEQTEILVAAFDTAWQILKASGDVLAASYRAASTRELLAKCIVEIGREGERDPIRLAEGALVHLKTLSRTPCQSPTAE